MLVGYGYQARTHQEVCTIFKDLHPERDPVSRPTNFKTLPRFNTNVIFKYLPKTGRKWTLTNEVVRQTLQ